MKIWNAIDSSAVVWLHVVRDKRALKLASIDTRFVREQGRMIAKQYLMLSSNAISGRAQNGSYRSRCLPRADNWCTFLM